MGVAPPSVALPIERCPDMRSRIAAPSVAAVASAILVLGVLGTSAPPASADPGIGGHGYLARITRASYGVPHITAADFGSLGFGEGYVQAQDNICVIADKIVTVNGQRARYFGASGPADPNIASDLFFQQAKDD